MNTFEAPPRTARVIDLPPPFAPRLPSMQKIQRVATMPGPLNGAPPGSEPANGAPEARAHVLPSTIFAPPADYVPSKKRRRGGRKRKRKSGGRQLLSLLVLLGLVGGGLYAYRAYGAGTIPHPDRWDPQLTDVVAFVENERGLQFKHPVFVDLLSDAAYKAHLEASVAAVDERARAEAQDESEVLDALGLTIGPDVVAASDVAAAPTTLGAYSLTTGRITVKGESLTPAVRLTLVHELTHALQAQHFDLHLGGEADLVTRSVAEGDAGRVEAAYFQALLPEERAFAVEERAKATDLTALAGVPWPVLELRNAPLHLGPALVRTVFAERGNDGVNALFRDPPTELQLLSPWKWSPGIDAEPVTVEVEEPVGQEIVRGPAPLSKLRLLVMLDAWLPWSLAQGALDSLQAASSVVYHRSAGGPLCIRVAAQFVGTGQQFADAVTWWAGAAGSVAKPVVADGIVTFETCTRGRGAAVPPAPAVGTAVSLVVENRSVPEVVRDERAAVPYLCAIRALLDDPAVARIVVKSGRSEAEQAAVDAAMAGALQRCGV